MHILFKVDSDPDMVPEKDQDFSSSKLASKEALQRQQQQQQQQQQKLQQHQQLQQQLTFEITFLRTEVKRLTAENQKLKRYLFLVKFL